MINIERRPTIHSEKERQDLIKSMRDHIVEQSKIGPKNYSSFRPGEYGSPTYRYDQEGFTGEAVYEIENYMPDHVEVRRYFLSEFSIRKEGYIDGPRNFKTFTAEEVDLDDGDEKFVPLNVKNSELETLSALVYDPEVNAHLLESLPHLPGLS